MAGQNIHSTKLHGEIPEAGALGFRRYDILGRGCGAVCGADGEAMPEGPKQEDGRMHMNYFVLQVAPREEEKTETHIRKLLPAGLYGQCFHPTRMIRKKFHGKWVEVHERLLPGYVFITTDDAAELYTQLKKVPLLTRLLGMETDSFVRLSEREERWLDRLLGQSAGCASSDKNEVGLSQIDIQEGNAIRIVSGPLKDLEGMIRKINLHRMIAEVEVPFMKGETVIHLGVEMVERK